MIPRTIHQIWLGGPVPPSIRSWMSSWTAMNGDWSHELWTDERVPELVNADAFDACRTLAQKADMLRYELLFKFGGLYVDADFECLRPISDLIGGADLILASERGIITNSFLGSSPQHPLTLELITKSRQWFDAGDFRIPANVATGPHLIERAAVEGGYVHLHTTTVLASDFLFPPLTVPRDLRQASEAKLYARHHALASWKPTGRFDRTRKGIRLRTRVRSFLNG